MFDCVMPTRNARNASIFTNQGRLNIKKACYKNDFTPLDSKCHCLTCLNFTRAYLHHLFRANEMTYAPLASIHNLHFYITLLKDSRQAIINQTWQEFKKQKLSDFGQVD